MMLAAQQLPHSDCPKTCGLTGPKGPIYAKSMGCGGPTEHAQAEIVCPACGGDGCDGCEKGKKRFYECPQKILRRDPETFAALQFFTGNFSEGRLPGPGGMMDQPAAFVTMMTHLKAAHSRIEARRIEEAEAKSKSAARLATAKSLAR